MGLTKVSSFIKSSSLSRDYFFFSALIIMFVIMFSSLLVWRAYESYANKINHQLELEASNINHQIEEIFKDTTQLMRYAGSTIVNQKRHNDLAYIFYLLSKLKTVKIGATKNLSGNFASFDWINSENLQTVNIKEGIVKNPKDMSIRTYSKTCKLHPWTLQTSEPAIGIPSGLWVIPAALGLTDATGKYLGAIVTGFNIEALIKNINAQKKILMFDFILLDRNFRIILDSKKKPSNNLAFLPKKFLRDLSYKNFLLKKPLEYNEIMYSYIFDMPSYPYRILIGFDKSIFNKEIKEIIFARVFELFLMATFCIILLYFFRKKLVNPIIQLSDLAILLAKGETNLTIPRQTTIETHNLAKSLLQVIRYVKRNKIMHYQLKQAYELVRSSEDAKEEFLRKTNAELKIPLNIISWHTDILISHLEGRMKVTIPFFKQLEMLFKVKEAISDLQTLTTDILNRSYVNIQEIIKNCLIIEAKTAFLKNINIDLDLQKEIPLFYGDELRLKQVIVGLLSLSIAFTPKGGSISLIIFYQDTFGRGVLNIILKDNGFSLDKEDIVRISADTNKKSISRALDGEDLDLDSIEKLVRMHQGTLTVTLLKPQGKEILLQFPYIEEQEPFCSENKQEDYINRSNVLNFPKKLENVNY